MSPQPKPKRDLFEMRHSNGKGRGLFAVATIPAGTLLECAPCIRVPKAEYDAHLKYTVLEHYVYTLKNGDVFVSLGMGSIFNHDKDPNIDYRLREDNNTIEYFAIRRGATGRPAEGVIEAGTELCIYYGDRPEWDVYTDDSSSDECE